MLPYHFLTNANETCADKFFSFRWNSLFHFLITASSLEICLLCSAYLEIVFDHLTCKRTKCKKSEQMHKNLNSHEDLDQSSRTMIYASLQEIFF